MPDRDPESPGSLLYPADDGDRAAYFAAVEHAGQREHTCCGFTDRSDLSTQPE